MSDMLDFLLEDLNKEEEKEEVQKKASVFDLINAITNTKNVDSLNFNKSDLWFIIRYLCHDIRLHRFSQEVTSWFGNIDNYDILKYLEKRIPKGYYKVNYQKTSNDKLNPEHIEIISEFFKVSKIRAIEYLEMLLSRGEESYNSFVETLSRGGFDNVKEGAKNGKKRKK